MNNLDSIKSKFFLALVSSSVISLILLLVSSALGSHLHYAYLAKNLLLAWIPLLISLRLLVVLRNKSWTSYEALLCSFLWLIFLPNAFYMITDFIHIQDVSSSLAVYYSISFTSIIINAVIVGFVSLLLIYRELSKRSTERLSLIIALLVLLASSMAVYLGRDLRWNSWDVFINPGGVLFDLTQRIISPSSYLSILGLSGALFIFLGSIFILIRSVVYSSDKS